MRVSYYRWLPANETDGWLHGLGTGDAYDLTEKYPSDSVTESQKRAQRNKMEKRNDNKKKQYVGNALMC